MQFFAAGVRTCSRWTLPSTAKLKTVCFPTQHPIFYKKPISLPISGARLLTETLQTPPNPKDGTPSDQTARIMQLEAQMEILKSQMEEQKRLTEKEKGRADFAEGSGWVLFKDLSPVEVPIPFNPQVALNQKDILIHKLKPSSASVQPMDQDITTLPRSPPTSFFKTDIFGSSRDIEHHLAHLVPHSRSRAARWISILQPILAVKIEPKQSKSTFLYEKMVEGFRRTVNSDRTDRSGLIFQPYNNICLKGQAIWFDEKPSCCIFPILSFSEMVNWDGAAYEAIFMGSEASAVLEVGANRKVILQCGGDDPRVQTAFSGFRDAASTMLGFLKAYGNQGKDDSEFLKASEVDLLLKSLGKTFFFPLANTSSDVKYRIVKFSGAKALGDTPDPDGHPAPIPLLLVAKSLNAWFSHLLRNNMLGVSSEHMGNAKYYSIFPYCGVDESDASCPVCLARMIVRSDPALEPLDLSDGDYEHAQRIADNQEIVQPVESDPLLKRAASILLKVCTAAYFGCTYSSQKVHHRDI